MLRNNVCSSYTQPKLSGHFLTVSDISIRRPKTQLHQFSSRDFLAVDPLDFSAMQMTDVYFNPANDVDIFYTQTVSSVTAVLDALAPLRTHVKRRGKRSS